MSIVTKTFTNRGLARAAIATAKATWAPPPITYVRPSARILAVVAGMPPLDMCADATELTNGRWAVLANNPAFVGETIEIADIKYPPTEVPVVVAQGKAAIR